tara:strand:- start:195 stop:500 length:306 start_codon:yes stop_codon:yes gene_type:complete
MNDWADVPTPTVNFAVFPNKYCTTDRHPKKTGKIEITREFLKAMLERAKTGEMPVLKVAMWEKTSQSGISYDNFKLELARPENPVTADKDINDDVNDDFPF